MRAVVVYESMWGNTEQVARAVHAGLAKHLPADLYEVNEAPEPQEGEVALLVLGGPTHAFSMSRQRTREDAHKQGAPHHGSAEIGIREWIDRIPKGRYHELVATFDTRIDKVRKLPGSAAKGAAKAVRRLGFVTVDEAESFYVSDVGGPLLEGELDRAERWGSGLAAAVLARTAR